MHPMRVSSKDVAAGVLALMMWLVTVTAGMIEIYLLRQTYIRLSFRAGGTVAGGVFGADVLAPVLALVWVVFALGTGEFHRKYVGQTRSWRAFLWTGVVELAIMMLYPIA